MPDGPSMVQINHQKVSFRVKDIGTWLLHYAHILFLDVTGVRGL